MENRLERLKKKANALPLQPGVYLMHDSTGKIIYIGKAKVLRNRVTQYFGAGSGHTVKVRRMVSQVADFEYIVTDSEFEALVLECSLIKQNAPKYNILLKDDKGYHYIYITPGPWRRIRVKKQKDTADGEYIGPYVSSFAVNQAVDEVNRIFRLPTCTRRFPQDFRKARPCLNASIDRCCAVCQGRISEEEYEEMVSEARDYLLSGSRFSVQSLTEQMEKAAEDLDFEKAARLRDRIRGIEKITEKQKIVASAVPEQDVIALAQLGTQAAAEVFRFQDGRLSDRESFLLGEIDTLEAARTEFLQQYYSMRSSTPPVVTLDGEAENRPLIKEWLSERAGKRVHINIPQRGEQHRLVEMCRANAAEKLAQEIGRTGRETAALDELSRLLGLNEPAHYIEAYDISNTAGRENVAGMVVFENGRPLKSAYRRFEIKSFSGQDDYASMREVLERRFARYEQEKDSGVGFGRLPDLILLDGGKGQVSAVLPVLTGAGVSVPLFGMVKDSHHRTRAIVSPDGGEIAVSMNRSAFTLLSSIQEEVHRFAVGYHRQKRSHQAVSSALLSIPGIGPAKAKALMTQLGGIQKIREADVEALCAVKGISERDAKAVRLYFDTMDG